MRRRTRGIDRCSFLGFALCSRLGRSGELLGMRPRECERVESGHSACMGVGPGDSGAATRTRLIPRSLVRLSWRREVISLSYNLLVKSLFETRFFDGGPSSKGITPQSASSVLPVVEATGRVSDAELLIVATKGGYCAFDLPVSWTEDAESRARMPSTGWRNRRGLVRLRCSLGRSRYANLRRVPVEPTAVSTRSFERYKLSFGGQRSLDPHQLPGDHRVPARARSGKASL